jgi:Flp pilus assembly protein TadG
VLVGGLLLAVAMVIVIGLAVDLGHAFIVRRDLASIADQAALTGSQAIDIPALHDDGRVVLDPTRAQTEALSVVRAEAGVRGSATASTDSVSVTVSRRVPTMLLGLAGLRSLTVSADASAAPQQP